MAMSQVWRLFLQALVGFRLAGAATISDVYPNRGSTEGGTYLVITGSGFMMPTQANPWDSQVVFVGSKICNILAHYTSGTQIVCITTPYDAVAQSSDYLTVSVQIFGGLGLAGYASKTRAFRYLYHDTPLFFWAREWAGTGGDTLQFAGNVYHGADTAGHYQIRVGDSGCATDEESLPLSFRRRGHRRKHVTCRLPEDELVVPGHYNLTVRVNSLDRQNGDCPNSMCFPFTQEQAGTSYGYGMAAIIQPEVSWSNGNLKNVWSGTIDLATAQAYHFTVYPQVNAIEPSVGSLFGGNNLTLHGSSFAPDLAANEVFVGGRRCEVLEASQHRLVCQVPAWGAAGIGDSSMRGLRYTRHDIRRRRRWTRWTISEMPPEAERPVDEAGFVKGFLNEIGTTQPWDYRVGKEQSMLELTGFFVPPLTANYSFYMCGDDQLSLELGDEHGDLDSLQPLARMEEWISTSDYALVSPFCWYFREDLSSGDFTGPRKKVSEPMRLSAGSRSPFRLRHIGYGGPNWLRMGLKVSGLSVALGEDEELLDAAKVSGMTKISPAMELQALRLSGIDVRREQHFIEIGNTTVNDSFKLRIFGAGGHQALLSFHHGVHRNTIRNEVRNAKVVLAGQAPFALHGCRSITVDTVPLVVAPKVRYLLTFHCALEAESAQWIDMELVEARGGNVTVGKLQNASAPVSGTFRVGHGGSWTGDLDAQKMSSRWWELAAAISSLRRPSEDRGGELELECWRFPSGWMAREGFQVLVRFRRPIGDVAPLEVQTTGFPAEFRLEAFTIEDGDADAIFLEKIPADMFQVPFPDPESETLQVVTEGIVGAFGGSEVLGYQYSHDLVPAVSSAQPTYVNATDHLTLVISGLQQNSSDGWVDDLQILIGDDAGLCGDLQEVQDSDNESGVEPGITVMCKLSDAAAGEHQLHLISVSQGRANPDAAPVISVDLVLEDFQPHFGSLAGGTLLRLSGSGVRNLRCSDVLVGGRQCSKPLEGSAPATSDKAANLEASLFCLTPPSASFDAADASTWVDAAMPVTIAQPPRSASLVRGNFVYKFGSTPIVQAVSPAVKSAAVSAKFLLQGSNLESNDDEVALVRFGPREAKVIAQTSSSLEVWLQRAAPEAPAEPVFEPSVWMSKKGFAAVVPGTVLESRFEVTSVGPLRASKAGGVVLAIAGAGFHPESAKHLISLSPADGAPALECLVIAGNSTHLDCRLQGSAAKIVAQQLPSTPATEVSEALDFLRRVEADDLAMEVGDYEDAVAMEGGYGDREVYGDGYDGYGDQYGPAADLENGADEASRRLGDSRLSVPIEIQIRPRWGVESDAAEDFRLAHIRPIRKRRSRQRDLPAVQLPRRLMSEDEDDELNDTSVDPNAAEETEVGSDDSDEPEDSDGSKQVASETISDDSDEPEDSDGSNQVASEDSQSSEMGSDDSDEPEDSDGAMPAASTTKPSTTKVVVPPILTVSEVLDLNNSALEDFDANASDVNASDESDNLTETEEDENVTNSSNSSDLDVPTFAEEEATEEAVDIDESFSLSLSLNGVRARCKAESGCGLVLSGQDTPLLTSVSPLNGSYADGVDVELTLFSAEEPEGVSVRFGEQLCPDVQIRNLTEEGSWWSLSLPLCTFEASNVPIYVHTTLGYALFASPFTGADFHFTQHLRLSSVYPLNGSFYGGTTITISGVGFGASPSMNLVTVGQVPCQVLSASYDEIRCLVPPAPEELQEEENRTKNITVRVITASQDLQPGLRGEYFFFSQ
ncbi:Pkhd1l1, partial [Symbiodinium sp. CCMP2592]